MADNNPIYGFLKQNGLTSKSETDFVKEYSSDVNKQKELYKFMKDNALTTKDELSFVGEYFPKQTEVPPTGSVDTSITLEEPTGNGSNVEENIQLQNETSLGQSSDFIAKLNQRNIQANNLQGLDENIAMQEFAIPEGTEIIDNKVNEYGFPVYAKKNDDGTYSEGGSILEQVDVSISRDEAIRRAGMTQDELIKSNEPIDFSTSVKNSAKNVWNQLQGADDRLSIFSADVIEKLLGSDLAKDWYAYSDRDLEKVRLDAYAELDRLGKEALPTMGIVEGFANNNMSSIAAGVINGVTSIFSTAIVSATTFGAGLVTEMVGGSLYDYNTAKAKSLGMSTEQLIKEDKADFWTPAAVGAVGAALERFGLKGVKEGMLKELSGSMVKKMASLGLEMNKEGMTEWVQTGLEGYNEAIAQGKDVSEATKALVSKMFSDEGLESYLQGVAGSGGAIAGGRLSKGIVSKESRDKIKEGYGKLQGVISDLSNNTDPSVKSQLLEVAGDISTEIQSEKQKDNAVMSKLNDIQRAEIEDINSQIESIDKSLEQGNLSEKTVEYLNDKKKGLSSQIEGIVKEAEAIVAAETEAKEKSIKEAAVKKEENILKNDNKRIDEILEGKEAMDKLSETAVTDFGGVTIEEAQKAYDEATDAISQIEDSNISRERKKEYIEHLEDFRNEIKSNETKFKTASAVVETVKTTTIEGVRRVEQNPESKKGEIVEKKVPKTVKQAVNNESKVVYNGETGVLEIGDDKAVLLRKEDGTYLEISEASKTAQQNLSTLGIEIVESPKPALLSADNKVSVKGEVVGDLVSVNKDPDGNVVSFTYVDANGKEKTSRNADEALDIAIQQQKNVLGEIESVPTERFREVFEETITTVTSSEGKINTEADKNKKDSKNDEKSDKKVDDSDSGKNEAKSSGKGQKNNNKNVSRSDEKIESKGEKLDADQKQVSSEGKKSGTNAAKNENSNSLREKYNLGEREAVKSKGFEKSLNEAREAVKSGKMSPKTVLNKALSGGLLSDVEQAVATEYVNQLELEIDSYDKAFDENPNMDSNAFVDISSKRDAALNNLSNSLYALERAGTEIGRALAFRRRMIDADVSLPSMVTQMRRAKGNAALSSKELSDVRSKYKEIQSKNKELEKRVDEISSELDKAKAEIALMAEKKKAELEYRDKKDKAGSKTEALTDIKRRREEARKAIQDSIKEIMSANEGFSYDPKKGAKQDINFLKALGSLVKTYMDEALLYAGKVNYDSVINNITADIKSSYPNITKQQVAQLIDNLNEDNRPTLDDIRSEIANLKEQILDRNLEANKESLKKRLQKLDQKIKDKDYKPLPSKFEKYDSEYRSLKKDLDKKIHDFKVDVEKAKYEQSLLKTKSVIQSMGLPDAISDKLSKGFTKGMDTFSQVVALPRALMATGDLSAPLRQGIVALIGNPITGIKAFKEMHKYAINEQYYLDYMDDIRDSEMYDLAQKSGLSITGAGDNVWTTLREEQWSSRLLQKVPIISHIANFSERGFAGFLNKMRFDLFNTAASQLMNEGKNPIDNIDQFKAIATYVNATTGRGPVPAKWENAFSDMSTAFFAPRLITSRLYLLLGGPMISALKSGNMNVAKMYVKDMSAFVSFGIATMFLASLAEGVDVIGDDDDEKLVGDGAVYSWTSGDFMNIKVGERRYDIWGGFAQYIRLFSRIITGQKTSSSGKATFADDRYQRFENTRKGMVMRFFQSKLSPTASFAWGALDGKNYMGEDFNYKDQILNMAWPLVFQETIESMFGKGGNKAEGPTALASVFAPSFYGIGVQTWDSNSFLDKGVDKDMLEVLVSKKLNTMTKRREDIFITDPITDKERDLNDDEFKKYTQVWNDYVKKRLAPIMGDMKKMSDSKAEKEFNKIKAAATIEAKRQLSGYTSVDTRVELNGTSYQLTPEQIKERVKSMNLYREENSDAYDEILENNIDKGMSTEEAELQARKEIDKRARAYSKEIIKEKFEDGKLKLKEKE